MTLTRNQTWFALLILFGINTMNFFDRQLLGVLTEPIRKEWNLSDSAIGLLGTAFTLIYAAVGGRLSLIGAVYGALLVGYGKTFFSENFVQYWLYLIGALFVGVVMFLPGGLASLMEKMRPRAQAPKEKAKAAVDALKVEAP